MSPQNEEEAFDVDMTIPPQAFAPISSVLFAETIANMGEIGNSACGEHVVCGGWFAHFCAHHETFLTVVSIVRKVVCRFAAKSNLSDTATARGHEAVMVRADGPPLAHFFSR